MFKLEIYCRRTLNTIPPRAEGLPGVDRLPTEEARAALPTFGRPAGGSQSTEMQGFLRFGGGVS